MLTASPVQATSSSATTANQTAAAQSTRSTSARSQQTWRRSRFYTPSGRRSKRSGQYITVDGKQYDAAQDWSGNGWDYHYYSNGGGITLSGYRGGSIESDVSLQVKLLQGGKNIITGHISAPELDIY